jgi:hypothetical protein
MGLARAAWQCGFLVAILVLAGCGGHGGMAEVHGTVTFDDTPLETGAIRFVPVDGKTKTTGGVIKNGQYAVQVPVGEMSVSISAPKIIGKVKLYDTPDSRERTVTEELLPAKYNDQTELRLQVEPGGMEKDFVLQSK